jgi:hypothetical protein
MEKDEIGFAVDDFVNNTELAMDKLCERLGIDIDAEEVANKLTFPFQVKLEKMLRKRLRKLGSTQVLQARVKSLEKELAELGVKKC